VRISISQRRARPSSRARAFRPPGSGRAARHWCSAAQGLGERRQLLELNRRRRCFRARATTSGVSQLASVRSGRKGLKKISGEDRPGHVPRRRGLASSPRPRRGTVNSRRRAPARRPHRERGRTRPTGHPPRARPARSRTEPRDSWRASGPSNRSAYSAASPGRWGLAGVPPRTWTQSPAKASRRRSSPRGRDERPKGMITPATTFALGVLSY